jgi:sulfur-carrier protein
LIRVRLTAQLKDWTGGVKQVELRSPHDVHEAVMELDSSFPGIAQRILDDQDRVRAHVNIFVNSENSRTLNNEKTRLKDGDVVLILPSVAGG